MNTHGSVYLTFAPQLLCCLPFAVFNTRPPPVMYICCGIPFFMFIFIYDELRKVGTALSAVQHMAAARNYVPASHGADVVLAGWHWFLQAC